MATDSRVDVTTDGVNPEHCVGLIVIVNSSNQSTNTQCPLVAKVYVVINQH